MSRITRRPVRVSALAALAALALTACGPEPYLGPSVALDLRVRGGHPGFYVARVLRPDGVAVAERSAPAARDGAGDRLQLTLPCDPSRDAQPNLLELGFDPPPGVAALIPPPQPLALPFTCDATTVRLPHELVLAATPPGALALGDARCTATVAPAPPELGGPTRVTGALRCDGPARVRLDLDAPQLTCGDVTLTLPLSALLASPPTPHLTDALPYADVTALPSADTRALDLALEPLFGLDCALTVSFRVREQDSPGTRPTVTWRLDATTSTTTVSYAGPAPTPAVAPPPAAATASWDGATVTLTLPLPPALAHPRLPNGGLLLAATTDDDAHTWLIHVTARETTALRDDLLTPIAGHLAPDGLVHLALPAGPGALVVAPLRHSDGPLGQPRALLATLTEPGPVSDLAPAPDPATARPLIGLPAVPSPGAPVLLLGLFPAPATLRVNGLALDLTPDATPTALAFAWPAASPNAPAATPALALDARWAPLAPDLCATRALCLPALTTPRATRHLTPPLPPAAGPVDDALITRLLDGDPRLGVAPVLVGTTRVAAFATGRTTCLAARPAPGDAVFALLVGTPDGRTHRFATATPTGERWGCADGALTDAAVALAVSAAPDYAPHGLDLHTSPAGVVLAVPTDAPRLVAVAAADDAHQVDVVVTGWSSPDADLTLHLGALPPRLLTRRAAGTWRAPLPPGAKSAPAWVTDDAGAATPQVWLLLAGSDSDGDGLDDLTDRCPLVPDPAQADADDDGRGDACDADRDGDGWAEVIDRCPGVPDRDQTDTDGDGAGDACDFRPLDPTEQRDANGDGLGDAYQASLCGNGVVDTAAYETCDDGNAVPHDGCEPDCRLPCGQAVGAVLAVRDDRTGHCFFSLRGKVNFDEAAARCEVAGGYLAIPDDAAENDAAYQVSRFETDGAWLGLDDRVDESDFRTLAGPAPVFTAWGTGEPTNRWTGIPELPYLEGCVAMQRAAATWQDARCADTRGVVCEATERPCGDGVRARTTGEECDDGNALAGDGCEPTCTLGCPVRDWTLTGDDGDPGDDPAPPAPDEVPADVLRALRDPATGHCLVAVERGTWTQGAARCAELGGHLWVPDDEDEDKLGTHLLPEGGWLGLHDAVAERDWRTVTGRPAPGQPAPYTNWVAGDSDGFRESCAHRRPDGAWDDLDCLTRRPVVVRLPYACEIAPQACGDGVIEPALGETCDPGDGALGVVCAANCKSDFELPPDAWAGVRLAKDGHRLVALKGTSWRGEAKARCEAIGGYLPVPNDPDEAAILIALGGGWLGLVAEGPQAQLMTPQRTPPPFTSDHLTALTEAVGRGPHVAITDQLWWVTGPYYGDQPVVCEVEPAACGDGVIQVARGEACDGAELGCGADCAPAPACAVDALLAAIQVARGEACDGAELGCGADCAPAPACDVDALLVARSPRTGRCVLGLGAAGTVGYGYGDDDVVDAAARCAEVGAVPYAPLSADEDRVAADLGWRAWTGVHDRDQDGVYFDADGAPVGLTFWEPGQPSDEPGLSNEDCVEMMPWGAWNDAPCGATADHVLCALAPPVCGDGRRDEGEACDDGNLVAGDGCTCPVACAAELAPRASFAEAGGRCLWASAEPVAATGAGAVCEAAGGHLLVVDDRWRQTLAGRLGGGWVAGSCARANATGGVEAGCGGEAPALCERAAEHCGDGVVQEVLGETCDDGNRAGRGGAGPDDGCGADCTLPCGPLGATAAFIVPGDETCLFRLPGVSTWAEASSRCTALGAHLVVPDDASEQATQVALGPSWVGVSKASDASPFTTVLGEPLHFAPWARGQPNAVPAERCVALQYAFGGQWDDLPCDLYLPVVCEAL